MPLDGDEAAAIEDVARQLCDAGVEPALDEVASIVRDAQSKPTLS